jgi:hypothetical protein
MTTMPTAIVVAVAVSVTLLAAIIADKVLKPF